MNRIPSLRWAVGLLPALLLSACSKSDGPERQPLAGTVTVNGAPLAAGRIRFLPVALTEDAEGVAAAAGVTDGKFAIPREEGVPEGGYRVEIEAAMELGFELDDDQAFAARGGKPLPPQRIPPQYNRKTTLTATIVAGQPNDNLNYSLEFPEPQNK